MNNLKSKLLIFLITLSYSGSLYANVGLPVIVIFWPLTLLAFIPILLIESFIYKKFLKNNFSENLRPVLIVNLITTLIGIPISWVAHTFVGPYIGKFLTFIFGASESKTAFQYFIKGLFSGWLFPYKDPLIIKNMVSGSMTMLFILCFISSWLIEYFILKKMKLYKEEITLKRVCLYAHFGSYTFLIALIFANQYIGLTRPIQKGVWKIIFSLM